MAGPTLLGRLGVLQRVLPEYRLPFFNALAALCRDGLSLFAGLPLPQEGITSAAPPVANWPFDWTLAHNRHLFDPSSPWYFCWQGGLAAWLEHWQPQALVVEANPRYLSTRLAVRWMRARRRPVLGWGLGAPPLRGPLGRLRQWERLSFLRSLDGVLAYSEQGAAEYRALGLPPEQVFVAHNAAAPRPLSPPPLRPQQVDGPLHLLFVGRLQARKRLDLLLRACAALPSNLQPRLTIVGDGPALAELQTLAREIYPAAVFAGAQHGPALEAVFAAADALALPGTGGLAVQQAMAAGLPVLVAQGDGTQNDLVRPQAGWLLPPGDLDALTRTLTTALSDVPRLRRMGQAAYQIVAEEINVEAMAAAFVRAFNQRRS